MRRLLFVVLLACAGCHESSGSSEFLAPGVNDLGFDATALVLADGVLAARTAEDGVDRNGDGDGLDHVLRILDLRDGRGATVPEVSPDIEPEVGGGFVAFAVPEDAGDLNGDGDALDSVLHVHDVRAGRTRNAGLAVLSFSDPFVAEGALVAAFVSEHAQGVDVDGDGRLDDGHVHVYDGRTGRTTVVPMDAAGDLQISDGRILFAAEENGAGDFNGDGDEVDVVAAVYDARTGSLFETERAVDSAYLDGALLALTAPEWENGAADLNQNGSSDDSFAEFFDLDTGACRATDDHDALVLGAAGGLAFVERAGAEAGTFAYDLASDTLSPLEGARRLGDLSGVGERCVAWAVDESVAGVDLDGDGQADDVVLRLFDARDGTTRTSPFAIHGDPRVDGTRVAFLRAYDGLPTHLPGPVTILGAWSVGPERESTAPPFASDFLVRGARAALLAPELWLWEDANADGDLHDAALRAFDAATMRELGDALVLDSPWLDGATVAFDGDFLVAREGRRIQALRVGR